MAATVRVLHQIQVSPSLPSQPPQRLSFLDTIWFHSEQLVERLFFYEFPHPTSHFINQTLPILTKSLSLALHNFYLLAGSILPCPDSNTHFHIIYTAGDTVTITVAEFTGDDFHNISGHRPRNLESLRLLVPKPAGQTPPISIQFTIFPNKGLCIGLAINHIACDGSASMQFIKSWAAAAASGAANISPPILDRSIIIDAYGIEEKIMEKVLRYREVKKQDIFPGLVHATFTLPKDRILMLKERVEAAFHISAFAVTCAYVWRCLVKAKGGDGDIERRLYFVFAVDWRSRARPMIPSNYFGNCLGACKVEVKVGELMGNKGVERAAVEIGRSIHGLQGKDVGEVFLEVAKEAVEFQVGKPLSVAGSPKLRVYETDFGWGRPVKVDVTSIYDSEAISFAESRDEEGGVEIGIVLPVEQMDKFVKYFSGDLLDI